MRESIRKAVSGAAMAMLFMATPALADWRQQASPADIDRLAGDVFGCLRGLHVLSRRRIAAVGRHSLVQQSLLKLR